MTKKALCVGINDYPSVGNDLRGCINDARGWAGLLTAHYDFPAADVKLLLDSQATKANMLAGLKALLAGAKPGDVLVFTNSSHGTYVADTSGDEPAYDEAICPYDCADNLIIDDELRELFVGSLPKNVHLTVISDSCFSGTVTREVLSPAALAEPYERRARLLEPYLIGRLQLADISKALFKGKDKYPQSKMKEILLSGCSDKQVSYDAVIAGDYHGAMSYFALKTIAEANYRISYQLLRTRLLAALKGAGYDQTPQIEGSAANKRRQIFT